MELREHLEDHRQFLASSCAAFDAGFDGEAKRMAVSVRVLVHDTRQSHALLAQMGCLDIEFWDTSIPLDPSNLLAHLGLVRTRASGGEAAYDAPLDDRPPSIPLRWTPFHEWWSAVVLDDRAGSTVSRKDIVRGLANKEGGAHVDASRDEMYRRVTKERDLSVPVVIDGVQLPMLGKVERVSMRQIAHEVIQTLAKHFPIDD